MESLERDALAILRNSATTRFAVARNQPWEVRQRTASELLAEVNRTWWAVHHQSPSSYERDLSRLNDAAKWTGEHAQQAWWPASARSQLIMPPKFFAGDANYLDEEFVASISLNHAILESPAFREELADQQGEQTCFEAHRDYFLRRYAYKRFFGPRAQVLAAFAKQAGCCPVPPDEDWRAVNRRFAFYIEAFPTRSKKFASPRGGIHVEILEAEVFVCALNAVVRDVVLQLLRPRRVLLAGRSTWDYWPDPAFQGHGSRVGEFRCKVFRLQRQSAIYPPCEVAIVRTNFLRTVHGPNSNDELSQLGRLLA